jgi:hypothetical protein
MWLVYWIVQLRHLRYAENDEVEGGEHNVVLY